MRFQTRPGGSTVSRLVKPAAWAAAIQAPRRAIHLPERSKERTGVVRIKDHGDGAGLIVLIEDLLPGNAAIGRAEDSPLIIRAVGMSECGHKDDVRVPGIDDQRADVPRVLEADILPGLAPIHGLVHAIAVRDVAANAGFARPHINN